MENLNNEIDIISEQLINDNNISLLEVFDIYDNYKENINNLNEILNDNKEFIINELDKIFINYINVKIKEGKNNKFSEEYYNKLIQENKRIFKDKIMKNISEQAKGTLDLILFGDM